MKSCENLDEIHARSSILLERPTVFYQWCPRVIISAVISTVILYIFQTVKFFKCSENPGFNAKNLRGKIIFQNICSRILGTWQRYPLLAEAKSASLHKIRTQCTNRTICAEISRRKIDALTEKKLLRLE